MTEPISQNVAGDAKPPVQLLDKRGVALMLRLSPRSINNLMTKGCPYLQLGSRRTRFIQEDVLVWLKDTCAVRRIGKLNGNGAKP
jgi:predicted DNA-binding transcriptional regulator AlpA